MKHAFKTGRLFIVLLFCGITQIVFAQGGLKEFFNNSEMPLVYLGIDFSKNKIINDPNANSFDVRNKLYPSINNVIVGEPRKYDFKRAFHKSIVNSDLTAVRAKTEKINAEDIISSNTADFNRLTESDISSVVKGLSISSRQGIGCLFVMEGMKKEGKWGHAAIWVALVDMKTKKVLMTERFEDKGVGFGNRNFWAAQIKSVLEKIERVKYKEWKAQYGS